MGCPPVRRDNSRALASGLSCVQVDKHTTYICVDLAHDEIFRVKVNKGGIIVVILRINTIKQNLAFLKAVETKTSGSSAAT